MLMLDGVGDEETKGEGKVRCSDAGARPLLVQ